jgi:zinc protease
MNMGTGAMPGVPRAAGGPPLDPVAMPALASRSVFVSIGVLLLALVRPGGALAAGTLDPASIRETVFPNGLRVVIKEAHAVNLVAIQYWVRAGGFRETEKTRGAAHFIEHLIFKGTDRFPQGGIDAEIEDLGGVLSAVTEKDWVTFSTTIASQYVDRALDVLGDALRHPKFRQEDLEAEGRVITDEIAAQRLDPDRIVAARLYRMAYPNHPYGQDVMGTPEAVSNMNRTTVQQFFADHYTPSNATLVVVGDVTTAAVLPRVKTAFGVEATPGNPTPAKLPEADPLPKAARETLDATGRLAYFGIGFPAPSVTDPDIHAADMLVTLLEQGAFGRLPAALSGIALSASATFETRRQPGLLTIIVAAEPATIPKVEEVVLGVVRDLATKGPTEQEVLATKSVLAGSYAIDNETFTGQANSLGYYASIDRWQFAAEYLPKVAAVTAAQVRDAAAKWLNPQHALTVVMRPRSTPTAPVTHHPKAGLTVAEAR